MGTLLNSVKSPKTTHARVMRFLIIVSLFGLAYSVPSNRNCGEPIRLDSQEIVDVHNRYRAEVASCKIHGQNAKNMKSIKWDETLAATAQEWANTCPSGHSSNDLGENIYWSWNKVTVVCNYSPRGNFLRRPVFEFGTPCSGC